LMDGAPIAFRAFRLQECDAETAAGWSGSPALEVSRRENGLLAARNGLVEFLDREFQLILGAPLPEGAPGRGEFAGIRANRTEIPPRLDEDQGRQTHPERQAIFEGLVVRVASRTHNDKAVTTREHPFVKAHVHGPARALPAALKARVNPGLKPLRPEQLPDVLVETSVVGRVAVREVESAHTRHFHFWP